MTSLLFLLKKIYKYFQSDSEEEKQEQEQEQQEKEKEKIEEDQKIPQNEKE